MTQQRYDQFPGTANAKLTDLVLVAQDYISPSNLGNTVKETLQQVYNLIQSNVVMYNSGNPNGVLAGQTYQFCWDITDGKLYICTSSGSISTAVWTLITTAVGTFLDSGLSGPVVMPGTGIVTNIQTLSITPGDWDVYGYFLFSNSGSTSTASTGALSLTSATATPISSTAQWNIGNSSNLYNTSTYPFGRISVSVTTTVYLVAEATYSAGTPDGYGAITARRIT